MTKVITTPVVGESFVAATNASGQLIERMKLALGAEYDLTVADRIALKLAGALAEKIAIPGSPPSDASLRLSLPANFLYRSKAEQKRLLAARAAATPDAAEPATA